MRGTSSMTMIAAVFGCCLKWRTNELQCLNWTARQGDSLPARLGFSSPIGGKTRKSDQSSRHTGGTQIIKQHCLAAACEVAIVAVLQGSSCVRVDQRQHVQACTSVQQIMI